MGKKQIFVIFKTHLDIGFTDCAENVIESYMNTYIPNAIKIGYELKDSDTPFVWTVGSWLIDRALKNDKTGTVEGAVRDGILNWHALAFTTHTELMSPKLFEYELNISKRLDERFGRKTIGSKMTDVPGHTLGMLPLMSKAGIKFMHIGINPATPLPPVPPLFRWKCGEDSVVVMYQGEYGEFQDFGDFGVCFAHTGDNLGPQSKEQIIEIYSDLRKSYPEYEFTAGTLNYLAERACRVRFLPVLENEIGDTWIHGAGTDPQKISRYKRVLREIEGRDLSAVDLTDNLLLVPEHTWGKDLKTFFNDTRHFTHAELEGVSAQWEGMKKSWDEQRSFVEKAERLLGIEPEYPLPPVDLSGCEPTESESIGFEISWQIFDNSDYERYKKDYMRLTEENRGWALWDFTKVGLPDYSGGIYTAKAGEFYKKGSKLLVKLAFDADAAEKYGLPYFYAEIDNNNISIKWFGRKMNRSPQACWLKFKGFEENWELDKMGQWIKPGSIVGSPLISAIDSGIRNKDCCIKSLDAALVAPFGRRLLHYADGRGEQDLYFNLYNNIWNTNFPMWYSDDAMFRFTIDGRCYE